VPSNRRCSSEKRKVLEGSDVVASVELNMLLKFGIKREDITKKVQDEVEVNFDPNRDFQLSEFSQIV
jgi:hypothetical protein